jgi:hypothetical protein
MSSTVPLPLSTQLYTRSCLFPLHFRAALKSFLASSRRTSSRKMSCSRSPVGCTRSRSANTCPSNDPRFDNDCPCDRIAAHALSPNKRISEWARDCHWHFGEEIDIGILEQDGLWRSGSPETRRSEVGQHKLRPDLRGLVGMILGLANP